MRYSVNYCGVFFREDKEGFNCREFSSFDEAYNLLWDLIWTGADMNAYIRDEEYQCSLYWDKDAKEFYWS